MQTYLCRRCRKGFTRRSSLRVHVNAAHSTFPKVFPCRECGKKFFTSTGRSRHLRSCGPHNVMLHKCSECSSQFTRKDNLQRHVKSRHRRQTPSSSSWQASDKVKANQLKALKNSATCETGEVQMLVLFQAFETFNFPLPTQDDFVLDACGWDDSELARELRRYTNKVITNEFNVCVSQKRSTYQFDVTTWTEVKRILQKAKEDYPDFQYFKYFVTSCPYNGRGYGGDIGEWRANANILKLAKIQERECFVLLKGKTSSTIHNSCFQKKPSDFVLPLKRHAYGLYLGTYKQDESWFGWRVTEETQERRTSTVAFR